MQSGDNIFLDVPYNISDEEYEKANPLLKNAIKKIDVFAFLDCHHIILRMEWGCMMH